MLWWVLWAWWNLMIISNESMNFKDLKESDDLQLFDDPSSCYSMIPRYSMIPSYLMIPSYSIINWKYGLWKSKRLRWYLHHWWSCWPYQRVPCVFNVELMVIIALIHHLVYHVPVYYWTSSIVSRCLVSASFLLNSLSPVCSGLLWN